MSKSSNSNTSNKTKTTFANTTTTNPYFTSKTNSKGKTTTNFVDGTAGEYTFDFINKNIPGLFDNYLRPDINSATNQAKLNAFNKQQQANLQNNIINPLATNNMVRSSQATNMYNNLSNQAADYTNDLIANSQNDTESMIKYLMNLYAQGYQGASSNQNASINASLGTGTTTSNASSSAK